MKAKSRLIIVTGVFAVLIFSGFSGCRKNDNGENDPGDTTSVIKTDVVTWLTKPDQTVLFEKLNQGLLFNTTANTFPTIVVDSGTKYQTMDGFGFALTGGSASLMNVLPTSGREALLRELFANDSNSISLSYMRISIGASDLDATVFSYNDMPAGQTDVNLEHFSIDPDRTHLIPILKDALKWNPALKILASPWSAPAWMKTNKSSIGGSLKPEYYDVYARYFVKYIQAMMAEGIHIDGITPQNEPLNPNNNPSMEMQVSEQADFIKNHLGPALRAAGITTKIIIYDHNCDRPDYPISILNDPAAREYIDGSAFHLYAGDITALTLTHNAHPDRNIYFTEQWVGGPSNFGGDMRWHVRNLIIGAPRNWSRNVIEWNLASDPQYRPHTNGGCSNCEGALTINGSTVTRNVSYYIIAHASKFVPSGSVRILTNVPAGLPNVAYLTPQGKKVLIVLNDGNTYQSFNIKFGDKKVSTSLSEGSVATYIW